ncbi:response regulator transcription factor [Roseivivax sp. CAU 1761]
MFESEGGVSPGLRILIADAAPIFAQAVADLLRSDPSVANTLDARFGPPDLLTLQRVDPAITVLDPLQIPRLDAFIEEARSHRPDMQFVAFASRPSIELAQFCIELNLRGFLPKSAEPATFVRAMRVVAAGGSYVDKAYGRRLILNAGNGRATLSAREESVLRLVSQGDPATRIAESLGVSVKTVDTQRARAMTKLGLADRRALIRHAMARGWLD